MANILTDNSSSYSESIKRPDSFVIVENLEDTHTEKVGEMNAEQEEVNNEPVEEETQEEQMNEQDVQPPKKSVVCLTCRDKKERFSKVVIMNLARPGVVNMEG